MGGVVGGRAKMAWTTRQYLCTASAAREKEKERNQRLGKRGTDGQNSVSGSSDNLSSKRDHPSPSWTTGGGKGVEHFS